MNTRKRSMIMTHTLSMLQFQQRRIAAERLADKPQATASLSALSVALFRRKIAVRCLRLN